MQASTRRILPLPSRSRKRPPHLLNIPIEIFLDVVKNLDSHSIYCLIGTTTKLITLNSLLVPILLGKIREEDSEPVSAWAATHGFIRMIHWLPNSHLMFEYVNNDGRTALYCAAHNGHTAMTHTLLTRGALLEGESRYRQTALHGACIGGQNETVEYLLNRGADMYRSDMYQRTGMDYAVINKHAGIMMLFLKHGMPVDHSFQGHGSPLCTPLHTALVFGRLSAVGMLLSHGADANLPYDANLMSPVHLAVSYYENYIYIASELPHLKDVLRPEDAAIQMMTLLIAYGANISTPNSYGTNALHRAVSAGLIDVVKFLLAYKDRINEQNAQGETALHICALNADIEMYNILIEAGLNPDTRRDDASTAAELLPLDLRPAVPPNRFWSLVISRTKLSSTLYLFAIVGAITVSLAN